MGDQPTTIDDVKTWDDLDQIIDAEAHRLNEQHSAEQFNTLVSNVLNDTETSLGEKGAVIVALASELPYRNKSEEEVHIGQEVSDAFNKVMSFLRGKARSTKRVDGQDHPADDFALIPDPELPSTWKLPIFDEEHISMAITALQPGGFRGQKVEITGEAKRTVINRVAGAIGKLTDDDVKNRLRARLASVRKERSAFFVFKDAEGRDRWFGWVTNKWRDRDVGAHPDGEIITDAAHKEYVEWVDKNPASRMPALLAWHTPETKHTEKADWIDYADGFLLASGPLLEKEAEAIERVAQEYDLGMSHGFLALETDRGSGLINMYRAFEHSFLPLEVAANPWTDFRTIQKEVEQMGLSQKKRGFLSKLMGDGFVEEIERETEGKAAELETAGVDFKEGEEAPTPEINLAEEIANAEVVDLTGEPDEPVAEEAEAESEVEAEAEEAEAEPAEEEEEKEVDPIVTLRTELSEAMEFIGTELKSVNARLDAVETTTKETDERIEEVIDETPVVSLKDLITRSVIGKPETRIDGRLSQAKDAPEETESIPEDDAGMKIPFLNQIKARNVDYASGVTAEVE